MAAVTAVNTERVVAHFIGKGPLIASPRIHPYDIHPRPQWNMNESEAAIPHYRMIWPVMGGPACHVVDGTQMGQEQSLKGIYPTNVTNIWIRRMSVADPCEYGSGIHDSRRRAVIPTEPKVQL